MLDKCELSGEKSEDYWSSGIQTGLLPIAPLMVQIIMLLIMCCLLALSILLIH